MTQRSRFERIECSREEAAGYFHGKIEPYKVELLGDIEGSPSMYRQGQWQDLCRGPHLPDTGYVKAIKLLSIAGAYWRGSEKNKMLQRHLRHIVSQASRMLDEHLRLLEEAHKRDHRKLGQGTRPVFVPCRRRRVSRSGTAAAWRFITPSWIFAAANTVAAGYQEVKTPMILNEELWHRSGHWDKYRENMYFTTIDEVTHAVKPMNCPGGLLIYKNTPHSYREFPIKYLRIRARASA